MAQAHRVLDGESPTAIAREWRARGVTGITGRPWSTTGLRSNLRTTVARVVEKAGLSKKVSPYDFRHAAISLLSNAGISGERIADVAGNDAKTALSVYRHRMGPVVDDAVGPMNDLFRTD